MESAICSIISSRLSLLRRIKPYFDFDSSLSFYNSCVNNTLLILLLPRGTCSTISRYAPARLHKRAGRVLLEPDFSQASISLFSKLQWISVYCLIKYREVVLPNASKIDYNSSPFHVDL